MWFDFLRLLTFNYTTNHTFFCSNKLLSKKVLAYKFLGIGKQNMTYLIADIVNLNVKPAPTIKPKIIEKNKKKYKRRKKQNKPLKSLYYPGLYLLNQDYNVDFYKEFLFFVYRFHVFSQFYYYITLNNLFSLFFNFNLFEFDLFAFMFLLFNGSKDRKFKYLFIRRFGLRRREERRKRRIKSFKRFWVRRLRKRSRVLHKYKFKYINKFFPKKRRSRRLPYKRFNAFKFKFRFHRARRRFLKKYKCYLRIQKLKLLVK